MTTAHIDAKTVMALRQKTGLGFGDCRTALAETGGDMAKAEALLREKLKDKMDSRSDRAAGQGAVAVAIEGGKGAIVEVRAETDFTARNDEFVAMVKDVAKMALALPAGEATASDAITKRVDDIRIKTGENISFGRAVVYHGGHFGSYVHHDGKLGVLMQYEGELDAETAKGICQHIAGALELPQAVDESGLPPTLVAEKKAQARGDTLLGQDIDMPSIFDKLRDCLSSCTAQHDGRCRPLSFFDERKSRPCVARECFRITGSLERHAALPQQRLKCFRALQVVLLG